MVSAFDFDNLPGNLDNTLCVSTPKPLPPLSPGPLVGVLDELTEFYDGEIAAREAKCNEQRAWLDHTADLVAVYEEERITGRKQMSFLSKCLYAYEKERIAEREQRAYLTQCLYTMTLMVLVLLGR